jgi:hypothetical protein
VLAALLSTSFGAAVPTVEVEKNKFTCDWNVFINFFHGFTQPETEQYCSKATICNGKDKKPLPRDNAMGIFDTFISTLLNPPTLKKNEKEEALFGCQKSCRCPNFNSAE